MRPNEVLTLVVWAGLTYGLLRAVEDVAARLRLQMSHLTHGFLVGVMVVIAACLLYYLLEQDKP